MKKAIVFTALAFSAATLSAQYNIDLSRVTPPSIEYLKMGNTGPKGKEIRVNNLYMDEGGIPQLPVMGEFHYSRMHPNYWKDALLKMKASGINIVATYCLWSLHEEMEGELSWQEHLNLRRFIQLCKEVGLKVHLRIGPYCNAEIKNGGLPDWIIGNPNFRTRSNDPLYLNYVRRWYEAIYKQVKGLLYKDGGPIMAIQLENEYVSQGMIISHLMNLKKMAVEIGFDVPLYSMTHWMDSEYPKGEIVPYAGFYIEAPWMTSGKEEMPTSNFEFFTYNRLSDNIGTDIIKIEGDVESLNGENNDSPFFTCEIGVGSTTFRHRRAVVPEELAGEMINLRLGCGANLMGYYMYVGGSNPVGEKRTFQSSGPRINYDYQAPIREFGTLGTVMQETKKYNYFMNDFGTALAPAAAYLPTSNQNRNNLQWAVRLHNNSGYLFCSNYLYRNSKKDYKNVQFKVKLKDETLRIPNHKITVKDGTYFLWPFNQNMGGVQLKYATVQPICSLKEGNTRTFFFFEDDQIGGEYLLENKNIQDIKVNNGVCKADKNGYFINQLVPGTDCSIEITQKDGAKVRLVTLTEEESDQLWKGTIRGKEFVALTASSLIYDEEGITLIDNNPNAEIQMYRNGRFMQKLFRQPAHDLQASIRPLRPMGYGQWIRPAGEEKEVKRNFAIHSFAGVDQAWIRYASESNPICLLNGKEVSSTTLGDYRRADVCKLIQNGENTITFRFPDSTPQPIVAEIEILMTNGQRFVWHTDGTWTGASGRFMQKLFRQPAHDLQASIRPLRPMGYGQWIRPAGEEKEVKRNFAIHSFAGVDQAWIRYASESNPICLLNGKEVSSTTLGDYRRADVCKLIQNGENTITFRFPDSTPQPIVAEIEILMTNGQRFVWHTDGTWTGASDKQPVIVVKHKETPHSFAPEEHLALYEVNAPAPTAGEEETRMYINYKGDKANAYLNGNLVADSFYDGTDWILSLSRLKGTIETNPLVLRIDGLKSADANIYFEKNVNPEKCVTPTLDAIKVKQEYRFRFNR